MTITFEPQELERLAAAAEAMGISAEMLVREAVEEKLAATPREVTQLLDTRPIWEIFEENRKKFPASIFDDLPTDGASEVDHYLYGHPKRNS